MLLVNKLIKNIFIEFLWWERWKYSTSM